MSGEILIPKPPKAPKKIGRPRAYSKALGDEICRRLKEGESLRSIDRDPKMPNASTVYSWLLKSSENPEYEAFSKQYADARDIQADQMFEEIDELADASVDDIVGDDKSDNARVAARKLQVDTRKWRLGRMKPKKYGEKMDITSGGKPIIPLLANVPNNPSDEKNTGD